MQTKKLKRALLSKADIAQIAKEFKKEIDESYSDAFSRPLKEWEWDTEVDDIIAVTIKYNMWAENKYFRAATYTEPENREDAYGVIILDITACDMDGEEVDIENLYDLWEEIEDYHNTCEWS